VQHDSCLNSYARLKLLLCEGALTTTYTPILLRYVAEIQLEKVLTILNIMPRTLSLELYRTVQGLSWALVTAIPVVSQISIIRLLSAVSRGRGDWSNQSSQRVWLARNPPGTLDHPGRPIGLENTTILLLPLFSLLPMSMCWSILSGLIPSIFLFSRSYCYTVWSAIVISVTSVFLSVCLSVCNVVHCGSHGRCTGLKVVPSCS